MPPTVGQNRIPDCAGRILQILRAGRVYGGDCIAVHLHHVEHRLPVGGVAFKRPNGRRQFGAGVIGHAVQDRRDRSAQPATGRAVVSQTVCH